MLLLRLASLFIGVLLLHMIILIENIHARAIEYNETLFNNINPILEGSATETAVLETITAELERMDVPYLLENFETLENGYSRSANIYVQLASPSSKTVIVAANINNDTAIIISILLHIIEKYRTEPPPINIVIAFLGADYYFEEYQTLGSQLLINRFGSTENDALIYLNINTISQNYVLDIGSDELLTPVWLTRSIIAAFQEANLSLSIPSFWKTATRNRSILLREGKQNHLPPTNFFMNNGFSAIAINATPESSETVLDVYRSAYQLTRSIEHALLAISRAPIINDTNYLLLPIQNRYFIISEIQIVYIIIALFAVIIPYIFFRKKSITKYYVRLMRKHIMLYMLHAVVLFACFVVSTLIITLVLSRTPILNIWEHIPLIVIALKIIISLLIYVLTTALITKKITPKTGKVYGVFALVASLCSLVTFAIDLAFALITMWITIGTVCFTFANKVVIKLTVFIITVIFPLIFLFILLVRADMELYSNILFSNILQNGMFAIIALPIFFMYLRLRAVRIKFFRSLMWYIPLTVATGVLSVCLFFYDPIITKFPQSIYISESIDQNRNTHTITYSSNIQTKKPLKLQIASDTFTVMPKHKSSVIRRAYQNPYTISHTITTQKNFTDVRITIEGVREIDTIQLQLTSEVPLNIYSLNYPYQSFDGEKLINIFVEKNPQNPIRIALATDTLTQPITVEAEINNRNTLTDIQLVTETVDPDRRYRLKRDSQIKLRYTIENTN